MKYAIGIDLGGTSIKYGIVNSNGETLFDDRIPSMADQSANHIIEQLKHAVDILLEYANNNNITLCGIGIGTPGIVDDTESTVLGGAENLAGWENIPLALILEEYSGLKTLVNNDANVMGLAEAGFGAAKGCSDVIFLTIGTGIGGAIIIDNKLYGGYKNRGAELGHVPFIADGEDCACGSVGCLETYASAAAMVKRYKDRLIINGIPVDHNIDGEQIAKLYHEDDILAREVISENCNFLGHAIAGFINMFSPQKVIIGGGMADAGDFYIEKIRLAVKRYVIADCAVNTIIEKATLGNKAGYLGAAYLILNTK